MAGTYVNIILDVVFNCTCAIHLSHIHDNLVTISCGKNWEL